MEIPLRHTSHQTLSDGGGRPEVPPEEVQGSDPLGMLAHEMAGAVPDTLLSVDLVRTFHRDKLKIDLTHVTG